MRPCDEVFGGNGRTYVFTSSMGKVENFQIDPEGQDVAEFSATLVGGKLPVKQIRKLLTHTIAEVDGSADFDADHEIELFMQDFGLEECSSACMMILHTAIVGNVKKKIETSQLNRKRRALLIGAHLRRFGLLWAALLIIGTLAPWVSLNWLMTAIASVMV